MSRYCCPVSWTVRLRWLFPRSAPPDPQPAHGDEPHCSLPEINNAEAGCSDGDVRDTMSTVFGGGCGLFRPLLRFSLRARSLRSSSGRMPQEQEREGSKVKGGFKSKVAVSSLPDNSSSSSNLNIEKLLSVIYPDGHELQGGPGQGGEYLDDEDEDGGDQSPSTDPASSSAAAALAVLSDASDGSDEGKSDFSLTDGEGGIWGPEEDARCGESGGGNIPNGSSEISLNLSLAGFPELTFLGQGTMCRCFVAKGGALLRCHVVLKMAIEDGPEESERDMKRELALMQKLSHPNLASLLGAGSTPQGNTFIVMEYLDGGTLRQRIDANMGGLGFWTGVRYALQLASAMKYLHDEAIPDRFVMHRDLKPDNVGFSRDAIKLFGESSDKLAVKLDRSNASALRIAGSQDLGLAKLVARSTTGVWDFHYMSGEVESLRYMSPEVASQQPYNEKADVHSFGIVTWELVTGWLPYGGLSPNQFMSQAVQHGTRPLMQYAWDPAFKNMLASSWAEDPRERPSFVRIHEILDTLLKSKPAEVTGGRFTPKGTPLGGTPMRNRVLPRLLPQRSKSENDER